MEKHMKKVEVEAKKEENVYKFFCPNCFREVRDFKFDDKKFGERGKVLTVRCPSCCYVTRLSCHTEDYDVFGGNQFVYCRQHLRAHFTGWCTVGVDQKVGLGTSDEMEAIKKCRELELPLYDDIKKI